MYISPGTVHEKFWKGVRLSFFFSYILKTLYQNNLEIKKYITGLMIYCHCYSIRNTLNELNLDIKEKLGADTKSIW